MAAETIRTLLVADDEPQLIMLLQASMARGAFRVLTAADGLEALAVARREHPDVALLDGAMPMLDGFEVCRQLKSDPATRGITVIMLTARAEPGDRERGLAAGADDYMTKPFSPRDLLARLQRL
jgi:CheY-like chemotaxis protein